MSCRIRKVSRGSRSLEYRTATQNAGQYRQGFRRLSKALPVGWHGDYNREALPPGRFSMLWRDVPPMNYFTREPSL